MPRALVPAWLFLLPLLAVSRLPADMPIKEEPSNCLAAGVEERDRALHWRYLYETNGRQGIRSYEEAGSNASILIPGSDQLVVLWHGFMASPPEMEPLGRHLHRALGATIYIPLIPGFGSGHKVADRSAFEDWRESVRADLEVASGCHSAIALVGYSIGGGLILDYLLDPETEPPSGIRSVTLLSPYIETAGWMAPALRSLPRAGFMRLLRTGLRLRRLKLETLYRWSRRRYRDLSVLLDHPETYDQSFSLKAGINMLRLTRRLRGVAEGATSGLPVQLALSEADRTVGWSFTESFVARHFSSVETVVRYPAEDEIPHQIVVPEVNPRHDELFSFVADFVERHFEVAE